MLTFRCLPQNLNKLQYTDERLAWIGGRNQWSLRLAFCTYPQCDGICLTGMGSPVACRLPGIPQSVSRGKVKSFLISSKYKNLRGFYNWRDSYKWQSISWILFSSGRRPLLQFFWKEIKIPTGVENHWYQEPLEVDFYLCLFLSDIFFHFSSSPKSCLLNDYLCCKLEKQVNLTIK